MTYGVFPGNMMKEKKYFETALEILAVYNVICMEICKWTHSYVFSPLSMERADDQQ